MFSLRKILKIIFMPKEPPSEQEAEVVVIVEETKPQQPVESQPIKQPTKQVISQATSGYIQQRYEIGHGVTRAISP